MKDINLIGNEKGTTAVETAIISMLLLIFIFGIIEFGLLVFNKQVLTNASREGARAGVLVEKTRFNPVSPFYYVTVKNDKAFEYCIQHLVTFGSGIPYMDPGEPDYFEKMGPPLTPPGPSSGDYLQVPLLYDYDFLFFPFPTVQLRANTIMRFE
jgi:hypothetical protein